MSPSKKNQPSQFKGILAEPIDTQIVLYRHYFTEAQKREAFELDQRTLMGVRKLKAIALAKHYDIDIQPDQEPSIFWCQLAMCLAIDFVPGFREVENALPAAGRPRKWLPGYIESLTELIDHLKATKIFATDFQACLCCVKALEPKLVYPSRAKEAREKARSLQNLISKSRTTMARDKQAFHRLMKN